MSSRTSHLTAEERKALKENHSPGDTLKQKAGWGMEINLLFAALANAAGFDARMVRLTDRGMGGARSPYLALPAGAGGHQQSCQPTERRQKSAIPLHGISLSGWVLVVEYRQPVVPL